MKKCLHYLQNHWSSRMAHGMGIPSLSATSKPLIPTSATQFLAVGTWSTRQTDELHVQPTSSSKVQLYAAYVFSVKAYAEDSTQYHKQLFLLHIRVGHCRCCTALTSRSVSSVKRLKSDDTVYRSNVERNQATLATTRWPVALCMQSKATSMCDGLRLVTEACPSGQRDSETGDVRWKTQTLTGSYTAACVRSTLNQTSTACASRTTVLCALIRAPKRHSYKLRTPQLPCTLYQPN
eukprot:2243906-Pleurochrysis_carterae.AAC.1